MKFTIVAEQKTFLSRKGYLELEPLFSEEELTAASVATDAALKKEIKNPKEYFVDKRPDELFLLGRDLWRKEAAIEKLALNKPLARIAGALFDEKTVRIGYTQAFRTQKTTGKSPLKTPTTLQKVSCIQGVVCGLVIRLTDGPVAKAADFFSPYPEKKGDMTFFTPDLPITFDPFFQIQDQSLLLIVYCLPSSVYILEMDDPHTHQLKKEGYVFGDRLKNETHPLIVRG